MQRFIAHDQRYADLYAEILSRTERLATGALPSANWPMTAHGCMFSLYGEAPELDPVPWEPTPASTPDSMRAMELLVSLQELTREYQLRTGDLYPQKNSSFRVLDAER